MPLICVFSWETHVILPWHWRLLRRMVSHLGLSAGLLFLAGFLLRKTMLYNLSGTSPGMWVLTDLQRMRYLFHLLVKNFLCHECLWQTWTINIFMLYNHSERPKTHPPISTSDFLFPNFPAIKLLPLLINHDSFISQGISPSAGSNDQRYHLQFCLEMNSFISAFRVHPWVWGGVQASASGWCQHVMLIL